MKRISKKKTVWTVAIAMALLVGAAYASTNLLGGRTDWSGMFTPVTEADVPNPTPAPSAQPDMGLMAENALVDVPKGEYWQVEYTVNDVMHTKAHGNEKDVASMVELSEFLANTSFLTPKLPEGFVFQQVILYRDMDMELDAAMEPYAEEAMEGAILRKYRLPEMQPDDVRGYTLFLEGEETAEDEKTVLLEISLVSLADMEADDRQGSFPADSEEAVQVLNVDGMEHALYVDSIEGNQGLYMQYADAEASMRIEIRCFGGRLPLETLTDLFVPEVR